MNKYQKHLQWLIHTGMENHITKDIYRRAADFISIMFTRNPNFPVPDACTGPDKEMFYSWNYKEHHLEVEFIPDSPTEYFYRNRITEYLWSEEGEIPNKFWEYLEECSGEVSI